MSEECSIPDPTPEHEFLQKEVGTWDVVCRFFMAPDAPPMECTAVDTVTAIGPFWVSGRFESEFMGTSFVGLGQFGYCIHEKCFVSTWIDAMSPYLFVMKGNFDEERRFLNLTGLGPNPADGSIVEHRIEHEHVDDDHHSVRMYMSLPGGEIKTFEMDYTRKI